MGFGHCYRHLGGSFANITSVESYCLDVQIGSLPCREIVNVCAYYLHGAPDWRILRDVQLEEIRIDLAIIDLLAQGAEGAFRRRRKSARGLRLGGHLMQRGKCRFLDDGLRNN